MSSLDATPVTRWSMFCFFLLLAAPGIINLAWQPLAAFLPPNDVEVWSNQEPEFQKLFHIIIIAVVIPIMFVFVAVAAVIGVCLAPRVALKAPVIEAILGWKPVGAALMPQILPAVCVGFISAGMLAVFTWYEMETVPDVYAHLKAREMQMSLFSRIISGVVLDEIVVRWCFMTVFVWLGWRLVQNSKGDPSAGVVWPGIVATAGLVSAFSLKHFWAYGLNTPFWIVVIVGCCTIVNVGFGWLYWKNGFEAALLARVLTVVFFAVVFEPIITNDLELVWHRSQHMLL